MNEKQFRFQELNVWKHAAESFEWQINLKRGAFSAEQLRAATLSITNNIAEGSGSTSKLEFANFLNIARRSTFEVANILFLIGKNSALSNFDIAKAISEREQESRMLIAFIRTLTGARSKS